MNPDKHHLAPEAEWRAIQEAAPEVCRQAVSAVVTRDVHHLASVFYDSMTTHAEAGPFLDHNVVQQRLHASMQRWLTEIYCQPDKDPALIAALQRHVGEVHARIQLPVHLVTRGGRILKHELFARLHGEIQDAELHHQALVYAGQLMDLALELMTESYLRFAQRGTRNDEAYRLYWLGQNMSVERGRQRSFLLEWGQEVLFTLHRQLPPDMIPRLGQSEFGLWFTHVAAAMFEGAPELSLINGAIERVDQNLLPLLLQSMGRGALPEALIGALESELETLKFQVSTLFERQLEVENGRDALTRLLNRRFLPTVLNREIHLAQERNIRFALLFIDLDHFKRINDQHGHEAGDMVLQQTASILLDSVRSGDFVFRYGGEELLVMLVEVTPESALRIAEKLRTNIAQTPFSIGQGRHIDVTISMGLAVYDGHPDHEHLIRQADQALYQAKQEGRNRVCVAAAG